MDILLAVESAVSRAPQVSNSMLLNYFVERQPPEAKGQAPLFAAPGIDAFSNAGTLPCRGSWLFNGNAYFVLGTNLYRIDAAGNSLQVGSGIPGTELVGMSDNGVQLCIVNGINGWIYVDTSNTFTQITDPGFYSCNTVTFMDGFFIFDRKGTNEFFVSNLYDGLTYNALAFGTAEAQPGQVIATAQNLQLLFIFCSAHIELWYDAGATPLPFARYAGSVLNYGCISPRTITSQDGALFFLGADKIFYRLQANVPVRISSHPIEHLIELDGDITLAETFTLTIEGHKLIFLTFPTSNVTVCYDISTGKWHDRDSVNANFISMGRYRARTALTAYDSILLGDAFDGRVGMLNWQTYTEYGLPMRGVIHTVNQHQDRKRVFCSRFELDVEAGVGLVAGQGANPQVMLRRSTDGGRSYSKTEQWRGAGRIGEYTKRLRWLRQGQGREMMWQITTTDPVPWTIIQGHADITYGT